LALKIEEGVRKPARMLDIETLLHGHLAACDGSTGLIAFLTDTNARLLNRAAQAIKASRRIGIRVAGIFDHQADQKVDAGVTDAGRMKLPVGASDLGLVATFGATALCLQQLTLALAARNGTNPDQIRREQEPYREAAKIADANW
jgi:glucosamine 6-phosphate synthetase-like amidotransferase/phosphosugar isomerase protein